MAEIKDEYIILNLIPVTEYIPCFKIKILAEFQSWVESAKIYTPAFERPEDVQVNNSGDAEPCDLQIFYNYHFM